jgi:hypothetical protein
MRSRSELWGFSPLRELLVSEGYMGVNARALACQPFEVIFHYHSTQLSANPYP